MQEYSLEDRILYLYKRFPTMSYKDMAKTLNCNKNSIQKWFKQQNIHRDRLTQQKINNTNRNKKIYISHKAKEILIGTILGDASISKYNRNCESVKILNSNISIIHSIKQKEYVKYINDLLSSEGLKCNYIEDTRLSTSNFNGRTITNYGISGIRVVRNFEFNKWRDIWYPHGKKIVPIEIEEYFTPLAIAIWFMDDGSKHECSYYLHTEGFDEEYVDYLRMLLQNKYNIKTSRHKLRGKPTIYISGYSREDFTRLIMPYVCDSMKYKLWIEKLGLNKSGELLER